mgnify:CR=1 FL=1|jgi:hypothetical protein
MSEVKLKEYQEILKEFYENYQEGMVELEDYRELGAIAMLTHMNACWRTIKKALQDHGADRRINKEELVNELETLAEFCLALRIELTTPAVKEEE